MSSETVDANSITITERDSYYMIEFELDLSDESARLRAVSAQRDYMRTITGMDTLEYDSIKIGMEIWASGLLKQMQIWDIWSGKFKIFLTELNIGSDTESTYYYSYHPDDTSYSNINLEWAS